MDPVTLAAIIGAGATIGGALIARNWGERRGREKEREVWRKTMRAAPVIYTNNLSSLIDRASAAEGRDVITSARAIVSARDDLKGTLTSLSSLLNSDIDRLAAEVRDPEANTRAVHETIAVLKKKWPSKVDQVHVEMRKLFAELGLEREL